MRVGFELELKGAPVHVYPWKKSRYKKLTVKDRETGYIKPQENYTTKGYSTVDGTTFVEKDIVMYDYYYCPIISINKKKFPQKLQSDELEAIATAKMDTGFYTYGNLTISQMPGKSEGKMPCIEVMSAPVPIKGPDTNLRVDAITIIVDTLINDIANKNLTTANTAKQKILSQHKKVLDQRNSLQDRLVTIETDMNKNTLGDIIIGGWKVRQPSSKLGKIAPQISFAIDLKRFHVLLAHFLAKYTWIKGFGDLHEEIEVRKSIINYVLKKYDIFSKYCTTHGANYIINKDIPRLLGVMMMLDVITEHLRAAANGYINESVNKQILPFLVKSDFKEIFDKVLTVNNKRWTNEEWQKMLRVYDTKVFLNSKIELGSASSMKYGDIYCAALTGKKQNALKELDSWTEINCDRIIRGNGQKRGPVIEIRHMNVFNQANVKKTVKEYLSDVEKINTPNQQYKFYKSKNKYKDTSLDMIDLYWRTSK